MKSNNENQKPINVEAIELDEIKSEDSLSGQKILQGDKYLSVVKDVEIKLAAFLGTAELTVGKLFSMKEGEVLTLDKGSAEPVELKLRGQLVAKGNLVVVGDNFGIEITEVCDL